MSAEAKQVVDERLGRLRALVASATVTATSPDQAVSVVVGPRGAVLDITLTGRALRLDPGVLGAAIIQAAQQAATLVHEQIDAGLADLGVANAGVGAALHGELPPVPSMEAPETYMEVAEDTSGPTFALGRAIPAVEGLERAIEQLTAEAQAACVGYAEARERFAELNAEGASADGSVLVAMRVNGLASVVITPAALRHGPGVLSRNIMTAVRQASGRLATEMACAAQAVAGPRLDLSALVHEYLPEDGTPQRGER